MTADLREFAEAALTEAEALLGARRTRAKAAELLREALDASRDPEVLERIGALAVRGAASTRDQLARRVLWDGIFVETDRRIEAAREFSRHDHPALWESGHGLVAGRVELGDGGLVLSPHDAAQTTIPYRDIVGARLAGSASDALEGRATLILEDAYGDTLRIGIRNAAVFGRLVAVLA